MDAGCESNLLALGRELAALGSTTRQEFKATWSDAWTRKCRRRLGQIEQLRDTFSHTPAYWDRDIVAHADQIRTTLTDDDCALPVDVNLDRPSHERWDNLKALVGNYGQLLQEWPLMWRIAYQRNAAH